MVWLALAAALLAVAFHQVGTLSVWTVVLSFALKVAVLALVVIASAVAIMFVRRLLQR